MAEESYKLLIDNNLSVLLRDVLKPYFPEAWHVADLNLSEASDSHIWELAKKEFHAIVTKDRDFYDRVTFNGSPPKLVWITRGNCRNKELLSMIRERLDDIRVFLGSERDVLILQ